MAPERLDSPASAPRFTFFIPCLNEEPRIAGTLDSLRKAMQKIGETYEILVTDDGSEDRTSEVVREFQAQHAESGVRLHRNPVNLGVAYSFVEAAFRGRGHYFRLIWGDNVETPKTLVEILGRAGEADLIVPYYPEVPGKSWLRRLLSSLYTRLVNYCSGFELHYYNGSPLIRRYDAMRWSPHNHGFTGFLADLITQLLAEGASYREVAVPAVHVNKGGKSTPVSVRNLFSTGLTLLAIASRRLSYRMFAHKRRGTR